MARSSLSIPKFAAAGLLLLLAGCASQSEPVYQDPTAEAPEALAPVPTGPVKVALLLPLTGEAAVVGQDMLEAAQIALFDVGQTDLVLLPRNTGGTIAGASAAWPTIWKRIL